MKKIGLILLAFLMSISVVACGKSSDAIGASDDTTAQLVVLSVGDKLYKLNESGIPYELEIPDDRGDTLVRDYATLDDSVCVIYSVNKEDGEYLAGMFAVIEKDGKMSTIELDDSIPIYSAVVAAYDGDFYFAYSMYKESSSYEYRSFVYDATSNKLVETDKFLEAEQILAAHPNNDIGYGMSPLEMYKKYGHIALRTGDSGIKILDISGNEKYTITPRYEGRSVLEYSSQKGAVVYDALDTDISTVNHEYYVDFETGNTYPIGEGAEYKAYVLGEYKDCLVLVDEDTQEYGCSVFNYRLFDTLTGTDMPLFSNELYGNSYYSIAPYYCAKVVGNKLYYIGVDERKSEWYTCDIASENHEIASTTVVTGDSDFSSLGKILHGYNTFYFEPGEEDKFADCFADNGIENYEHYFSENKVRSYAYYVEGFQLDSNIKNADKINEKLKAYFDEKIASNEEAAITSKNEFLEYGYFPGLFTFSTNDENVSSVQLLGDKYVQIGYSGYDYFGGAHGMPYHTYVIYSLDTANEVTFADLYSGTQEEFAKIVADYSLESYMNNEELYYPPFDENDSDYEADLYQQFLDGATTEMQGYFDGDNYVIEYAPYEYGPYAAGFIEVPIPLSKLGIKF